MASNLAFLSSSDHYTNVCINENVESPNDRCSIRRKALTVIVN